MIILGVNLCKYIYIHMYIHIYVYRCRGIGLMGRFVYGRHVQPTLNYTRIRTGRTRKASGGWAKFWIEERLQSWQSGVEASPVKLLRTMNVYCFRVKGLGCRVYSIHLKHPGSWKASGHSRGLRRQEGNGRL